MQDRLTIVYDPGELDALTAEGFYPIDLPHDAEGVDVMILRAGGIQGFPDDRLIASYEVRRIPVDTGRKLTRKMQVRADLGKTQLDVTLFPRHAVVRRDG